MNSQIWIHFVLSILSLTEQELTVSWKSYLWTSHKVSCWCLHPTWGRDKRHLQNGYVSSQPPDSIRTAGEPPAAILRTRAHTVTGQRTNSPSFVLDHKDPTCRMQYIHPHWITIPHFQLCGFIRCNMLKQQTNVWRALQFMVPINMANVFHIDPTENSCARTACGRRILQVWLISEVLALGEITQKDIRVGERLLHSVVCLLERPIIHHDQKGNFCGTSKDRGEINHVDQHMNGGLWIFSSSFFSREISPQWKPSITTVSTV